MRGHADAGDRRDGDRGKWEDSMGFLSQDPQALVIHLMCGMRGEHVKVDTQISVPLVNSTHAQ